MKRVRVGICIYVNLRLCLNFFITQTTREYSSLEKEPSTVLSIPCTQTLWYTWEGVRGRRMPFWPKRETSLASSSSPLEPSSPRPHAQPPFSGRQCSFGLNLCSLGGQIHQVRLTALLLTSSVVICVSRFRSLDPCVLVCKWQMMAAPTS